MATKTHFQVLPRRTAVQNLRNLLLCFLPDGKQKFLELRGQPIQISGR